MRPMLAPKSAPSWPLLQAWLIAFQVSAGDGTTTAPLERPDSHTPSTTTTASPPAARPARHRIGSSDRMRRTGDCRRPRPAPFPRVGRTGATRAGAASSATVVSLATMGLEVLLGERRVVETLQV